MKNLSICFWLHFPSAHHMELISAVSRYCQGKTSVVFADRLPIQRQRIGWVEPSFEDLDAHFLTDGAGIGSLIDSLGEQTAHVFFGISAYPRVSLGLRAALRKKKVCFVWMEPINTTGWAYFYKFILYRIHAWRYARSFSGIFVTGKSGFKFLEKCGFKRKKLIEFCYPVNVGKFSGVRESSVSSNFRLIFIGRLVSTKRVDWLIDAIHRIGDPNLVLSVVGDGPEKHRLERLTEYLGLENVVDFVGVVRNDSVCRLISSHDLLVLPSIREGWGFVVNEALSVGVPVLISEKCGAQDFIKNPLFGEIFQSDCFDSFKYKLEVLKQRGKRAEEERAVLARKVQKEMSVDTTARYMIQHIQKAENSSGPVAPWAVCYE